MKEAATTAATPVDEEDLYAVCDKSGDRSTRDRGKAVLIECHPTRREAEVAVRHLMKLSGRDLTIVRVMGRDKWLSSLSSCKK